MEAMPATWADVKVGRHIRSKEGVTYKVVAHGRGHWGLVDREGNEKIIPEPPTNAPVMLFYVTQGELLAQIAEQFPGVEVESVVTPGDTILMCPPFAGRRAAEMISHIKLQHRHWVGGAGAKTPKQLIEAHDEMHRHPSWQWIPHVHTDQIDRSEPF